MFPERYPTATTKTNNINTKKDMLEQQETLTLHISKVVGLLDGIFAVHAYGNFIK